MVSREAVVLLFCFHSIDLINEKGEAAASPISLLFRPEQTYQQDDCFKCNFHIFVFLNIRVYIVTNHGTSGNIQRDELNHIELRIVVRQL